MDTNTTDCFDCGGQGHFAKNAEGDSERCATCHGRGLVAAAPVFTCRECEVFFNTDRDLFSHQASRHDY